jgi:hypothetical protein
MIRHTVTFKLKHPAGSASERDFLEAARKLAAIPTVKNFEALRQTSTKNHFDFGLCMEFSTSEDYRFYNDHPDHVHFVQTRWISEVTDFLELDYEPLIGT